MNAKGPQDGRWHVAYLLKCDSSMTTSGRCTASRPFDDAASWRFEVCLERPVRELEEGRLMDGDG